MFLDQGEDLKDECHLISLSTRLCWQLYWCLWENRTKAQNVCVVWLDVSRKWKQHTSERSLTAFCSKSLTGLIIFCDKFLRWPDCIYTANRQSLRTNDVSIRKVLLTSLECLLSCRGGISSSGVIQCRHVLLVCTPCISHWLHSKIQWLDDPSFCFSFLGWGLTSDTAELKAQIKPAAYSMYSKASQRLGCEPE